MKKLILIIIVMAITNSCTSDNKDSFSEINCNLTIIDNAKFKNLESDQYNFTAVKMIEGCLKITITYDGGCGKVSAKLVDSGDIFESDPPKRFLRFIFSDDDECDALKEKDFYFNLENLQLDNSNKVLLNFQNSNSTFLYEY